MDISLDLPMELCNRYLPKWPQMIVTGSRIAPEQAMEIIRRTDSFITDASGIASDGFERYARRALRLKVYDDFAARPKPGEYRADVDFRTYQQWSDDYHPRWGSVMTKYVRNEWISSHYIGGSHGWCHPSGLIWSASNVGKYPSIEEIAEDWHKIATAFPCLNIAVTLMDNEDVVKETAVKPVVSIIVKDGTVSLCEPDVRVHWPHLDVPGLSPTYEEMRTHQQKQWELDLQGFMTAIREGEDSRRMIALNTLWSWGNAVFGDDLVFDHQVPAWHIHTTFQGKPMTIGYWYGGIKEFRQSGRRRKHARLVRTFVNLPWPAHVVHRLHRAGKL